MSPRSKFKNETIDHIIATIHILRAKYDNDVKFLIGGDVNRLDISEILECYGALRQVVSVPTRKAATLSVLITDLCHPPTTLPPLQVDSGKTGKDSDHCVVVFAPRNNSQYRVTRKKKTIAVRPTLQSDVFKYEADLAMISWEEVFKNKSVDQ